jgi:hypothetical protein
MSTSIRIAAFLAVVGALVVLLALSLMSDVRGVNEPPVGPEWAWHIQSNHGKIGGSANADVTPLYVNLDDNAVIYTVDKRVAEERSRIATHLVKDGWSKSTPNDLGPGVEAWTEPGISAHRHWVLLYLLPKGSLLVGVDVLHGRHQARYLDFLHQLR